MEILQNLLLLAHVVAAFSALAAGLAAVLSKTFNTSHRVHVICGRIFFWGMFVIFITAVPLSFITGNTFLLLIALFSFYLALSGWCYAKNRKGLTLRLDWLRSIGMLAAAFVMAIYGIDLLSGGDTNGYSMLVFSGIGGALSINDLRIIFTGGAVGAVRIANHLTMMLAATIATITAFLLVNFSFEPAYILWLAPTVVITPIIVVWNFKIRRGATSNGVPEVSI
ncbi:hypothetical protein [Litorivivens sp.]|uniref:hypothetical protein n=1 Tax=Litorivivens sp. TaxID=2020868 RepID=UPI00356251B9